MFYEPVKNIIRNYFINRFSFLTCIELNMNSLKPNLHIKLMKIWT